MEKRFKNIFWNTNATDLINLIMESFYIVLSRKANVAIRQGLINFLQAVEFLDYFYF